MIKALQGQNFMAVVSSPGVLETSDQGDREAFQKAKILYKSCMNESECLLVPSIPLIDSKPNIQKNQCPVQQNPINIWLIHGAMPGKFIFKWMKMPWCSMKPQYIHLGCGKEVWWVPTLVWMQSFSFTRHKPVPSQSSPNQHWSHRSIFIPFLKTNTEWFHDTSYFVITHSVANLNC